MILKIQTLPELYWIFNPTAIGSDQINPIIAYGVHQKKVLILLSKRPTQVETMSLILEKYDLTRQFPHINRCLTNCV